MTPPLFTPHPDIAVRVDTIGRDRAPVLVVDNFAADTAQLVHMAEIAFERQCRQRDGFPGIVASAPESYARSAVAFLMPFLQKAFGLPSRIRRGGCDFQITSLGHDQLTDRQKIPHIDVPDLHTLASVHFLCGPPYLGTAFYRHRSTGFETISPERAETYLRAVEREIKLSPPQGNTDGDSEGFECIASYPAKLNSLIFFSAARLHSGLMDPLTPLTTRPAEGRLTLNMFLQFTSEHAG